MIRLTPKNSGGGADIGFEIQQKTPTLNNDLHSSYLSQGFTAPVIADRERMSSKEVAHELSAKKIEDGSDDEEDLK